MRRRIVGRIADARISAARRARDAGEGERAVELYASADALRPLNPVAMNDLIGVLVQQKREEEAAPYARRVLAAKPNHKRSLRVLSKVREPGEVAIAGWSLLADENPMDVEPWLQLARLSYRDRDLPGARQAALMVLDLRANHPEARRIAEAASRSATPDRPDVDWEQMHANSRLAEGPLAGFLGGDASVVAFDALAARTKAERGQGQHRLRLIAQLAADAYTAEIDGDEGAAARAFWKLKELVAEPEYADGLDRALRAGADVAATQADADGEAGKDGWDGEARLAQMRLDEVRSLVEGERFAEAILAWRELQPLIAERPDLASLSGEAFAEIGQVGQRALERRQSQGDLVGAWEVMSLLLAMTNDGPEFQAVADALTVASSDRIEGAPREDDRLVAAIGARVLARRPNPRLAARLAKAHMRLKAPAEALVIWQELAAATPRAAEPWLQIARCAGRLKQDAVEIDAIGRLLEISPEHPEGLAMAHSRGMVAARGGGDQSAMGAA